MLGLALIANTAVKQVVRRPRPDLGPELPPLAPTISSLLLSLRPRGDVVRRGRRRSGAPRAPLYAAAGAMALTRPYLGVHYPSDVLAGAAARAGPWSGWREDRHRRAAQRGQVVPLQRAHARRRAGGQLSVHDARAERRGRRRPGRAARAGGRDRSAPRRSSTRRSQFHDIAGLVRGAHQGEGLGNQFLGNIRETDAILHVVRAHDDAQVVHPEGRVDPLADVETIETELLYADLEQAERRLERVAKQAKSGDKELVAEERWLREVVEALRGGPRRAHRAGSPDAAPRRGHAAVGADLEAGALRGERGRGRAARAAAGAGGARPRARRARHRGQRPPGGGARRAATTTRRRRCARSWACTSRGSRR